MDEEPSGLLSLGRGLRLLFWHRRRAGECGERVDQIRLDRRVIGRFLERELEGNQFDGVIFIQGNQPISGFQIRTCSRFIATEVLWPAVELAQRFVPLAPEPIRLWPSSGTEPTSIFNLGHLRPRPFCLSVCTPRQQPGENQISAIVFGIKQILHHYRAVVGYAGRL